MEFVLVISHFFIFIDKKLSYSGGVALHQPVGIPKVVVPYIIHSLQMFSEIRSGHAAFLITPTEVMLLLPVLSVYVHKRNYLICGISKRASPSTDSILLPAKDSSMRSGKWRWAISFSSVAL